MVSQEKMSGNWNTVVGKVKEKFGQITHDDLTRVQGNMDQLVGLIERKAGQTREQAEAFLSTCYDKAEDTYKTVADKGQQIYNQAAGMFDEGLKQVGQKAGEGLEYAKETVTRRPTESIAVVAGLGVLAGIVIGISMCSKR
jgi:uncharacterized protein YjbJ (UPF0337 family)